MNVSIADLKPDNVGFAADGTLKLFDFGLVTCVRTRSHSSEAYNMTGMCFPHLFIMCCIATHLTFVAIHHIFDSTYLFPCFFLFFILFFC